MFCTNAFQYFATMGTTFISTLNMFIFINLKITKKLRIFSWAKEGSTNAFHKAWTHFRRINLKIVENDFFEAFIMFFILISSVSLTLNDVNLKINSDMSTVIKALDVVFTFVFVVEMILKWFGLGLKKYFTDPWCLLDFFIVLVNLSCFRICILSRY